MQYRRFEKGIVTIKLEGRITSENIGKIEEELFMEELPEDTKEVMIDATDLISISSAGLRCIIAFNKRYPDIPITVDNVSLMIYEIFEDTGFTMLFKVRKALRYIDITGLEELGKGMYGAVYRVDNESILKVFYRVNSRELIENVLKNVRLAFVNGIPTIIPFDMVKTNAGFGMVFELMSSDCIADLIHRDPEKIDFYAAEMAELAGTLAEKEFEEGALGSRKEMLRNEIESASLLLTAPERDELTKYIDAVPERNTAVHGDFHARNIYIYNGKPLLIDMDDFCQGHPIWDIACLYRVYPWLIELDRDTARELFDLEAGASYEDFYYQVMHVNLEEGKKLWETFLEHYFEAYEKEDVEGFLNTARFYAYFMVIRFIMDQCRNFADQPEKLTQKAALIRRLLEEMRQADIEELITNLEKWR